MSAKRYRCGCPLAPGGSWDDFDGDVLPFACPEHRAPEPPPTAERVMAIDEENERRERQQAWGAYTPPAPVRFRR